MCITISEAKIKIKKKQKHYHSLQTKASLENRKFTSRGFGSILHHYEVQRAHFQKKSKGVAQIELTWGGSHKGTGHETKYDFFVTRY